MRQKEERDRERQRDTERGRKREITREGERKQCGHSTWL